MKIKKRMDWIGLDWIELMNEDQEENGMDRVDEWRSRGEWIGLMNEDQEENGLG